MPWDPDNPTFYGESMPVDWANDVTGDAMASHYRVPTGSGFSSDMFLTYFWDQPEGSVTEVCNAGDSFIVGFYPEYWYIEADTVAECLVVLEFEDQTSGTIRLSAGTDPDWLLETPGLASESLGTYTVTGKTQLVVPTDSITAQTFYDSDEQAIVFVEVLSGYVELRQMRIRVWPPDGPQGAWVTSSGTLTGSENYPTMWKSGGGYVHMNPNQETGPQAIQGSGWGPTALVVGPHERGWLSDPATDADLAAMASAIANAPLEPYLYFGREGSGTRYLDSGLWNYGWSLSSHEGGLDHFFAGSYFFKAAILEAPKNRMLSIDGQATFPDPDRVHWEYSDSVRSPEDGGVLWSNAQTWTGDIVVNFPTVVHPYGATSGWSYRVIERPVWAEEYQYVSGGFLQTSVMHGTGYTARSAATPVAGTYTMPVPAGAEAIFIEQLPMIVTNPATSISQFEWGFVIGQGSYVQEGGGIINVSTVRYQAVADQGYEYFEPALPWDPSSSAPDFLSQEDIDSGVTGMVQDAGEYIYTGEVDTSSPTPHLWFVFRPYAFGGDHILVYGYGLGDPQSEYSGRMFIDWGPIYAGTDWEPTVVAWTESPADDQAYAGEGQIFPGTDAAPPVVNVEVQVVELVVPPEIVGDAAYEDYIYAVTTGGTSNRLTLMVYPIVPHGMESTAPANRVNTEVRIGSDLDLPLAGVFGTPISGDLGTTTGRIPELYAHYTPMEYIVSSNRPERMPEFSALGFSKMTLASDEGTAGAEDPVTVPLEMQLRWRPLESEIEPRPDLGTGASVWTPTVTSSQGWKFLNESAPYVDPDNAYTSRYGPLTRPAMVFDGTAWMELVNAVPIGPTFTLLFVAHLHATSDPKTVLLSSNPTGTPDPDAYPLELALLGDQLQLTIGSAIASVRLSSGYIGQRPVIIGIRTDGTQGGLSAIAASSYNRDFTHAKLDTTGLKLYFARSNDPATLLIPRMEVLDMGFSDYKFTYTTMWRQMNFLDSAYGVSQ